MIRPRGFTLIEMLVAMAVTALLLVILTSVGDSVVRAWQRGSAQAESYSTARGAISSLGRELESAVIDLDMGFVIEPVTGELGNFVIKFLRRRDATDGGDVVEKTAYQLAWAGSGLLPSVSPTYDSAHPIPVLIRTSSTNLDGVYTGAKDDWAQTWGTLTGSVQTGVKGGADGETTTEIAADNVVGWKILPKYWDGSSIKSDDSYYDRYLTSERAPDSLEVQIAIVPSRSITTLSSLPGWDVVRTRDQVFDYSKLGENGFDGELKKHLRTFTTTLYLSSRTP
jgi:prepilin-type N-terminal cleavage/methylation domain-containing protein